MDWLQVGYYVMLTAAIAVTLLAAWLLFRK